MPEVRPVERDEVLAGHHEVHPDRFAEVVGETEGTGDTAAENVQPAGAGQVLEVELGGRRDVVADDDELAHTREGAAAAIRVSLARSGVSRLAWTAPPNRAGRPYQVNPS